MTVEEIFLRMWKDLGEPSDMDPFTYTDSEPSGFSDFGTRLLGVLNDAQVALATWRFPDGQRLRFPGLRDWFFIEATTSTGTLSSGQPSAFDTLTGDFSGYSGWVIEVNSEYRMVLVGTATSAVLDRALSSDPSGLDYTLYQRVFGIGDALSTPSGPVLALYGVYDFTNQTRMVGFEATGEDFASIAVGTPGKVRIQGKVITFDNAPSEGRYGVEVYRGPAELATLASESELPEQYHEGLVLYLEHWGYVYMQESESAYALKRDLNDFLRLRRSEDDLADDKRNIAFVPKVE